jgi:hypothetical protein
MALQPLWALASFQFPDLFTIGRTPWTGDQFVARPLPKHRTAQTQSEHIYTPNIHALSGTQTHDHSVRASEDSSCLRPPGYRDRLARTYTCRYVTVEKIHVTQDGLNKTSIFHSRFWINNYIIIANVSFYFLEWGENESTWYVGH